MKNLYIIFLILFSGLGINYFRKSEAIFLVLLIAFVYSLAYNVKLTRNFLIIIVIWMVYAVLNTISISSFHPYLFIYNPILFYAAFVAIKIYGKNLIFKYERIIYILTLISFVFMGWHILHESSFYQFMETFNLSSYDDYNVGSRIRYNIAVYNVNHNDTWGLPRNSGFCWEPGPFGSFIVIAMFFNLIRTRFSLKKNKIFFVLFAGLFTTQSTTAIVAFFIVLIWLIVNNINVRKILIIILPIFVIITIILFLNISILRDKIYEDFSQTEEIDETVDIISKRGGGYAPGRFASLKITLLDFAKRPLFGYGADLELRWTKQLGADIQTVSGVGNILAQYGLFGFALWIIGIAKSSKYFNEQLYKVKFPLVWVFIVILISIGFSIVISPIFLSFYMLPFFEHNVLKRRKLNEIG